MGRFFRLCGVAMVVLSLVGAALLANPVHASGSAPAVVVSIKPVHSLVAAIMQGVGEPQVLLQGSDSPHTFNMRPSQARLLSQAQLVFWVGPGLETFLEKPLLSLGAQAQVVTLAQAPGLQLLDYRSHADFEAHRHDGHDHAPSSAAHAAKDMHVWLNPDNARLLARAIAASLSQADPANAQTYERNRLNLDANLQALDAELSQILAPVQHVPFIVFHDAYQYLERRYDLTVAAAITISPEVMPGAAQIASIRSRIRDAGVHCVFAEPQFQPRIIQSLTQDLPVQAGILNPEGGDLPAGPQMYFTLMRGNVQALHDCLGRANKG